MWEDDVAAVMLASLVYHGERRSVGLLPKLGRLSTSYNSKTVLVHQKLPDKDTSLAV